MKKIQVQLDECKTAQKQGVRALLELLSRKLLAEHNLKVTDEACQDYNMRKTLLKFISKTHPDKHE